MANSTKLELPSLKKLQSAEQMELLDVVDSLRARGLSEIVALPQLIVCGDQSSGKSSVLEAISGIPFPRQDNLCTRFATEVVLRRATKDEISVSILPGKERTQADRDRLLQFRHELNTRDDLVGLFDIAMDAMRLPASGKSFSNDVLRIEFCGPSQPQLTLVDLPGLIHSETKSQSADDIKLVHNLVSQYLQNPRSIILAVVSAKNDIGNQIILHRARGVDPQGLRTLGIITKPDTLVKGSKSEEAFITLARNEEVKFSLGWHVVKNLDYATKNQNNSRDKQEDQYFKESSFSLLPPHTVGITFLRSRLSKVLFDQIRKELPRLVDDIENQIAAGKAIRDKLGPSRAEIHEQRSFLISLSESFQSICRDAVKGDYDHRFFQDDTNPERRLCANVMNMHFTFAENMRKQGASWTIQEEKNDNDRCRTREEAIKEACILLKRSRGRELPGLPNPLLVGELFREYSRPWGDLARLHIENVWEATNRFLELLLKHLTDDDASEKIVRFWLHPIMEEKLTLAYAKLNELLDVHKDHPMTTNNQFTSKNRNRRQQSSNDELDEKLKQESAPGHKLSIEEVARVLSTMNLKADPDMDMVAAEEAFDNMNAFYNVALNLFTDNVPTLAIQGPIIREVPKTLCPTAVFSMDVNMVKKIAGETEEKTLERAAILRRLEILENGARLCKQYAKRPQFVISSLMTEPKISDRVEQKTSPYFPETVPATGISQSIFARQVTTPVSNNSSSNLFGGFVHPRDSAISASAKSSGGLFGSGSSAFGKPSGGLFGGSSPTPFPTQPSNGFSFGSSQPTSTRTSIESGGPFSGSPASKSTKSSGGIFGSVPSKNGEITPTPFGSSHPSQKSTFGSSSAANPSLPAFGAGDFKPKTDPSHEQSSQGVINTTKATAEEAEVKSTYETKFESYVTVDRENVKCNMQSIIACPEFQTFSPEELRVADYARGYKCKIFG